MKDFINSLAPYKELIISSLSLVAVIVGFFIKRRPKTIDDFTLLLDELITCLPRLISDAEKDYEFGHGPSKKAKVMTRAVSLMEKNLGRSLTATEREYVNKKVDASIESILSTPQKKL